MLILKIISLGLLLLMMAIIASCYFMSDLENKEIPTAVLMMTLLLSFLYICWN